MKKGKEKILNLIMPIVSVAIIFLVWTIASLRIGSEYILPSIKQTAIEFFKLFKSGEFYISLGYTAIRSIIAFVFSFALAFVLVVLSKKVKYAKGLIKPLVGIMRALPTIAIVLLLLFWTTSNIAPIVVTTIVVAPTLYTHIESAFFTLDKNIAEAGRVDGADEKAVFCKIELPQILPSIYTGIGSGISLNFKLMVAAEVISQTAKSIGFILNTSKVYFEVAKMLALVCVVVILCIIIESIFNHLARKAKI